MQRGRRVQVHVLGLEDDEHHGQHRERVGEPDLHPGDRGVPEQRERDRHARHDHERDRDRRVAGRRAEPLHDALRSEHRQGGEQDLPAEERDVADQRRYRVADHTERRARDHERGGVGPLAGQADEPDEQERQHGADDHHADRLGQVEAVERDQERAVGDVQDADVGRAPDPEQLDRLAVAFILGDRVDPVGLDAPGPVGLGGLRRSAWAGCVRVHALALRRGSKMGTIPPPFHRCVKMLGTFSSGPERRSV